MVSLLTGSSRGIGNSITQSLIDKGYVVIGTSRSDESPFQNEHYQHIKCDLSDHEQVNQLKEVFESENPPEVLINNAAYFGPADFEVLDEEWFKVWDQTMQVNLKAVAQLCKWAVNTWKEKVIEGRIINISSRAGQRGDTQEYAAYAASKAGMIGLTKSIARSFGKIGITAYSIAPGFVNTDMARESIEVYGAEYLTSGLALNEIAPPEEIANLVLLLAEGKLTHATGQTFHVNSGSYLP